MAHLWTQFRDLIAGATVLGTTTILALTGAGKIHKTRTRPATNYPTVSVFTGAERRIAIENDSRTNTSDKRYRLVLDLFIEVIVEKEVDGDDDLDALCLEIQKQMGINDTLGGTVLGTDYASTIFSRDGTGETSLHVARLTYQIEYRIESQDPETSIM